MHFNLKLCSLLILLYYMEQVYETPDGIEIELPTLVARLKLFIVSYYIVLIKFSFYQRSTHAANSNWPPRRECIAQHTNSGRQLFSIIRLYLFPKYSYNVLYEC